MGVSSSLERMKKILGSPLGSRKKATTQQQYFGVPLEALLRREDTRIPHLVSKICEYVLRNGVCFLHTFVCVCICLAMTSMQMSAYNLGVFFGILQSLNTMVCAVVVNLTQTVVLKDWVYNIC